MTPIRLFLLVAFTFSWTCFGVLYGLGGFNGAGIYAGGLVTLAMFGPAIGALVCAYLYDRGHRARTLGLRVESWKRFFLWLPYAWMMPCILAALSVVLCLLVMGAAPADPAQKLADAVEATGTPLPMPADMLFWIQIGVGVPIGILINTLALTFSEELGWRGWLQPRLAHLGFWKMSALIGLIWGLWHAPIILMGFNYPGLGWGGVLAMCVFCMLITPYLSLLRERGAGAWGAGAFHGSINAVAGASLLWMPSVEWPHMGLLGLEGFALVLAGWAGIWFYRRARPVSGMADQGCRR
ncbi:CPBP family intramembrane glutamic endopeptidase [Hyphomonas pacifica]|uniref:CPBP family intramembrane glutamic endopeptidase n=1 Tax=Hyphomonas pacifica TaxID=1280941 RepID=UPI0005567988|nr:CPBP family intramembrane glutamic endopeptidase [Hyphomonas pacifica]